jgi:peptidyl-prolyl cis-trans isomerase SurA
MKKFKKIILIFFYSLIIFSSDTAIENKILFKVDNEIITSIDILTELKYLGVINNDFNKLSQKKAFEIAKNSLIREKVKEIELKNIFQEVTVEEEFLNNVLINNFKSIGIKNMNDFEKYFTSIRYQS